MRQMGLEIPEWYSKGMETFAFRLSRSYKFLFIIEEQ